MGNIRKIYYEEVDPNIIDLQTAGEFYYLFNLLGTDERFIQDFERTEMNQLNIRNNILGERKRSGDIDGNIQTGSSTLTISSLKNKVILIADVR